MNHKIKMTGRQFKILTETNLSKISKLTESDWEYVDDNDTTISNTIDQMSASGIVNKKNVGQKNLTSDMFANMKAKNNYWWNRTMMGGNPQYTYTKEDFEREVLNGENMLDEWGNKKRYFGGNSGYVGYSKSRRAVDAEDRGLKNKSQMDISFVNDIKDYVKNETGEDIKITLALVRRELPNINSDEWHHTSKYGNKTEYYSIETIGDYFINQMNLKKIEPEQTISPTPSPKYNADYLRRDIEDRIKYRQDLADKGFIVDLDAQPGQKVEHENFGNGIVKDILDDGRVYVIDFDNLGEKKLLKRFARLKLSENKIEVHTKEGFEEKYLNEITALDVTKGMGWIPVEDLSKRKELNNIDISGLIGENNDMKPHYDSNGLYWVPCPFMKDKYMLGTPPNETILESKHKNYGGLKWLKDNQVPLTPEEKQYFKEKGVLYWDTNTPSGMKLIHKAKAKDEKDGEVYFAFTHRAFGVKTSKSEAVKMAKFIKTTD